MQQDKTKAPTVGRYTPENTFSSIPQEAINQLLAWLDKEFTPMPLEVRSLIAAAPELLGACKPFTQITGIDRHGRIIKEYPDEGTLDFRLSVEELRAIQSAIRKARGE